MAERKAPPTVEQRPTVTIDAAGRPVVDGLPLDDETLGDPARLKNRKDCTVEINKKCPCIKNRPCDPDDADAPVPGAGDDGPVTP